MAQSLELIGVVCPKCQRADFLATDRCIRCGSQVNQTTFTGRGKVATFTIIRYPPRGFEEGKPYIIALIDLDEGLRIIGRIQAENVQIVVGTSVRLIGKKGDAFEFALE